MVKSRRAASASQSSVKATAAWRPSVSTSRRRVVISNTVPSTTAVTVPWASPVGITRTPRPSSSAATRSGVASVATSMSLTARPARLSRTQPPTKRAVLSAAAKRAMRVRAASEVIHGPGSMRPAGSNEAAVQLPSEWRPGTTSPSISRAGW